MSATTCPATVAVGPGGWQGTTFVGCATPVTDPATGQRPAYDLVLTWYGVQTDGPLSSGVVTSDMYRTNAQQIIAYMLQSPLNYTGICLHVDSPVGNSCANQGKPSNFVGDVDMMVELINSIPPQYRVGFHVVVEQDATWQINSSQPCPGHYQYKPTSFASINPACVGVTGESEAASRPDCAGATADTEGCCYYVSEKPCWPIVQPIPSSAPECAGVPAPEDNNSSCYVYDTSTPDGTNSPPVFQPGCCWAFNGAHGDNPLCPKASFLDTEKYVLTTWGATNTVCAAPYPNNPGESPCPLLTSSVSSSCCTYLQYAQCAVMGPGAYAPGAVLAYAPSPAGECTQGASIRSAAPLPAGFEISSQTVWYGGSGDVGAASAVTSSGYPYQAAAAAAYNGENACPYKATAPAGAPDSDIAMPPGCPNNLGKVGWYCALINAKLRAMGSPQIVSMMNWDAEGNGPDGLQCSIFQFLYGLRQYGTTADVNPVILKDGVYAPAPWILYQNGSAGLAASVDDPSDSIPCGQWAAVDINLVGQPVTSIQTYGQMAVFQAAPEYYWFDGDDMGGVADGGKPGQGMLQSLVDAGYFGCPQSGVGKQGYDSNCGCRNTVYETYGHLTDGGIALVDLLCELYGKTAANVPTTTPAFSIEHLGDYSNPINFSTCINAQNFCDNLNSDSSTMTLCGNNSKCTPRCGVANFFGGWTEECFKQFLDYFALKYGAKSLMVYDAGFIPTQWVAGKVDGVVTTPNIAGCADAVAPSAQDFIANQWSQYGISVTDPCPLSISGATRYICGDSSSQGYKVSPDGTGLIIPQNLKCWTCSGVGTCTFLPGDAGVSSKAFQQQKVCEASQPCSTDPPVWATGPVVPTPGTGPVVPTPGTGPVVPTPGTGPVVPTPGTGPVVPTPGTGPVVPTPGTGPVVPTPGTGPIIPTPGTGPVVPTPGTGPVVPGPNPAPSTSVLPDWAIAVIAILASGIVVTGVMLYLKFVTKLPALNK